MVRDRLSALKQYGAVSKYNQEFTALALQIPDLSDAEKLDRYLRGLKTSIKVDIELAEPTTLADAMAKAQRIDNIHVLVYLVLTEIQATRAELNIPRWN